jgi:HAE1 family hydrophobic/amphiphilic exporter-1
VIGGAEKRIQVDLDPDKVKEKGLSTDAVVGALSGAEVDAPVGSVTVNGRETPVSTTSELGGISALEDLPVGVDGGAPPAAAADVPVAALPGASAPPGGAPPAPTRAEAPPRGASVPPAGSAAGTSGSPAAAEPVLLGDVAEVREVGSGLSGISRTNGEPSLGLNVIKETDANTVEVAEEVEGVLDDVRHRIGRDQVVVVANAASDVEESVNGLVEEALVGAVLAILVIFAFLRSMRATLVTAVSLPTSVLAALLFSWVDNLTLNIITLAGLTIAVGRVVDDAIVVLENSYRYVQSGYEPEESALKGTTEVASAITSSTLTTIAVFLPLALVGRNSLQVLRPALADGRPRAGSLVDRGRDHYPRARQHLPQTRPHATEGGGRFKRGLRAREPTEGRTALAALHSDVAPESAAQTGRVAARAPYFRRGTRTRAVSARHLLPD